MNKRDETRLHAARGRGSLVRIERELESGWVNGFVVALSEEWVLLEVVSSELFQSGFQSFRLSDIARIYDPAPHSAFTLKALGKRAFDGPHIVAVDPTNARSIIESSSSLYPLITVHRELIDANVCDIGRLVSIDDDVAVFQLITPDATWRKAKKRVNLRDVTRIDFGGPYEEALAMVCE